jgi:hypothetical protein
MTDCTYKEIIAMRDDLTAKLAEKIGQKPAAGFSVEANFFGGNKWQFNSAYTHHIGSSCRVEGGAFTDPRDAYEDALNEINALPDVEDKKAARIAALKKQIAELEGAEQ